jgi:hypothetical protein
MTSYLSITCHKIPLMIIYSKLENKSFSKIQTRSLIRIGWRFITLNSNFGRNNLYHCEKKYVIFFYSHFVFFQKIIIFIIKHITTILTLTKRPLANKRTCSPDFSRIKKMTRFEPFRIRSHCYHTCRVSDVSRTVWLSSIGSGNLRTANRTNLCEVDSHEMLRTLCVLGLLIRPNQSFVHARSWPSLKIYVIFMRWKHLCY